MRRRPPVRCRAYAVAGVVLLAALGFAAAGCSCSKPKPIPASELPGGGALQQLAPGQTADRTIKGVVELNLKTDPRTMTSPINVSVSNRVVTLSGSATGEAARQEALELAKKVPDVGQVVDQMQIAPAGLP